MSYATPTSLECLARTLAQACGASGAALYERGSAHRFGSWRRSHSDESHAAEYALGADHSVVLFDGVTAPSPEMLRVAEFALRALVECDGLRRDVRKFLRNAQASHEIGREISSLGDREQVYHLIVSRARELMHCDLAGVAFAGDSPATVTWRAVDGSRDAGDRRGRATTRGGVSGRVIRTRRMVVVDDVALDGVDATAAGTLSEIEDLGAILAVPLESKSGPAGCLLVGHRQAHRFSDEEIETFKNFAAQVAVAVENAELYDRTRRERALMHSIVESVDDGLLLVDNAGTIAHVNRRAEELFRVARGSLVGRDASDGLGAFCHAALDPRRLRELILRFLAPDATIPAADVTFRSEPLLELRISAFEPLNASGKAIGRVVLFRDVTFERHVDALKTDVIAIVSHELRSPLASIRGCASALLDGSSQRDAAVRRSYLEAIDRESARLTELLSNLTDASLIDAGVFRAELQASDPIALAQRVATRKGSRVVVASGALDAPLFFDHRRVEQVLDNLVDNALKYSPGTEPIEIGFEDRGDAVVFSVTDTGVGIPAELHRHVFERFYRIDGVRRKGDGTGLGLFICRGIVEAHGGRIWIDPDRSRGASISFTLPRERVLA